MQNLKYGLESAWSAFVRGVAQIGQALLLAVENTCREGGVYNFKNGEKFDNLKYDPEAIRILKLDTFKTIKALLLLRIAYMKKVAWHTAIVEKELTNMGIEETLSSTVSSMIGKSPDWVGVHGFPRCEVEVPKMPPEKHPLDDDNSPAVSPRTEGTVD